MGEKSWRSSLKVVEGKIDAEIDEIYRKIRSFLEGERVRLVGLGRKLVQVDSNVAVDFRTAVDFSTNLETLLSTPLGKFELADKQGEFGTIATKERTEIIEDVPIKRPVSLEELDENRGQQSKIRKRIVMEQSVGDTKILAIQKFETPYSIAALPDKNCFAVKSRDGISFFSPDGEVLSSYPLIVDRRNHRIPPYCLIVLAFDSVNDQLICTQFGYVDSFEKRCSSNGKEFYYARPQIKPHDGVAPNGVAISQEFGRLYTCFRKSISAYSLKDWKPVKHGPWRWEKWRDPVILGVNNRLLFLNEDSRSRHPSSSPLYSIPLDEQGDLIMAGLKECAQDFGGVTGLTFDRESNILAADRTQGLIQVLSPDGCKCLGIIRPSLPFRPCSLALLSVPLRDDDQSGPVLGAVSHSTEEVFLFGLSS